VRGRRGGRREHVGPAAAHHAAGAAPGVLDPVHPRRHPRPAGLRRGVRAHQRRAERLVGGADDADLQARLPERRAGGRGGGRHRAVRGHARADRAGPAHAQEAAGMMRFDSALGLESRRGPFATVAKILAYSGMVVVFTGPLVGLLISAFNKTLDPTSFTWWPDEFTFENFVKAADRNVYRYLFNSFVVVGFGLLLQMIVSVFAAYSLARKKFRGM